MSKAYIKEDCENGSTQYSCSGCGLMYDNREEAKECYLTHKETGE